jgi:hypothetical protein
MENAVYAVVLPFRCVGEPGLFVVSRGRASKMHCGAIFYNIVLFVGC